MTSRRIAAGVLLLAVAALSSGCEYLRMVRRKQKLRAAFENQPRLALQQRIAPEASFRLTGTVTGDDASEEPLLAVAVSDRGDVREVVGSNVVAKRLALYSLMLPAGKYHVLMLADLDDDGIFEGREVVGRTPIDDPVLVGADLSRDGFLIAGPAIAVDRRHAAMAGVRIQIPVSHSGNVLPSLDDEFFDPRWGQKGLFDPVTLLAHTQGYLFGIEELGPGKLPVLFVHGAGGTPRDFRTFVEHLDRKTFQPWFFFYPSGLPLHQTGMVLAQLLTLIADRYEVHGLTIVAHSMGGLVVRSALDSLCAQGRPPWLSQVITFASPYGGHDAAAAGVNRAAEVVPSWRDLVPGNPFLEHLFDKPLPPTLPFHLVFAYDNQTAVWNRVSGDGTIPLRSQVVPEAMRAAHRTWGIDASHEGVLEHPASRALLAELLAANAKHQPGTVRRSLEKVGRGLTRLLPGVAAGSDAAPR